MAWLCALRGNPTIALPATDKVIGNLFGGFSAGDSNPIPPSLSVIDEDMRTTTLNSRLSFESHSIAAGCVANLSAHLDFTARQTVFSDSKDRLHYGSRASRLIACQIRPRQEPRRDGRRTFLRAPTYRSVGSQRAPTKEANRDGSLARREFAKWRQTVLLGPWPEGPA